MENKTKKFDFKIRQIDNSDRKWIRKFIAQRWASEKSVSRGKVYYPHKLPGFIAFKDKKYLGLITYNIKKDSCEIITLNSIIKTVYPNAMSFSIKLKPEIPEIGNCGIPIRDEIELEFKMKH